MSYMNENLQDLYPQTGISVLQTWVSNLPLRAQGTLLTVVRGCDLTPKLPLDSTERKLVGALRHSFLIPADPREVDVEGAFFQSRIPTKIRWSELGHYPWHWLSHIVHAMEVLGYGHPEPEYRRQWTRLYYDACTSFHIRPETWTEWDARINEDRIKSGQVVG